MVSLREIELHEGLYAYTQGAVRDALKDIVGVQFRNWQLSAAVFGDGLASRMS